MTAARVTIADTSLPVRLEFDGRGRLIGLWPSRSELAPRDLAEMAAADLVDAVASKLRRARRQGAGIAELRRRAELALELLAQLEQAEELHAAERRSAGQ